ncbi:MAG: phage portal protein [Bacteroidota bacterium]
MVAEFKQIVREMFGWKDPAIPPQKMRGYAAAQTGRLVSDFVSKQTSLESDWVRSLVIIRERARDLVKNDDYAKKAVLLFRANVIGSKGFKFQSNVRELALNEKGNWIWVSDAMANTKIEEALADWSKRNHCSISGMNTFRQIQDLAGQYWFRDGEAFIRGMKDPLAKYGFRLQMIEPEAIDETLNQVLPNGNVIKMGVEVDKWRRPVNYYIKKPTAQSELYGQLMYTREYDVIPAGEMIHVFDQEFVNQTRGISLLVQSMIRLHMLGRYEEAALINARVAANKVGWFMNPEGEIVGDIEPDAVEDDGTKIMSAEPGEFHDIGNKRFESFSPEYPTAQHEMFVKTILHATSAGVGVAYASLTNDLGDTSYSSARVGLLEERELWKLRQQVFVETFLEPVFERWLPMAILSGALKLPMSKLEKFTAPVWIGRRWAWVDPLKDITAMALARKIKIETLTQQLAEKGEDLIQTLQEFAEEEAEAQKWGLSTKIEDSKTPAEPGATDSSVEPADGGKPAKRDEGDELLNLTMRLIESGGDARATARREFARKALEVVKSNGNHED